MLYKKKTSLLTKNFFNKKINNVWMSHQDQVVKLPSGFQTIASTKVQNYNNYKYKKKIFGVQFHPEVTHTDKGKIILKNFIFSICKVKKTGYQIRKKKIN